MSHQSVYVILGIYKQQYNLGGSHFFKCASYIERNSQRERESSQINPIISYTKSLLHLLWNRLSPNNNKRNPEVYLLSPTCLALPLIIRRTKRSLQVNNHIERYIHTYISNKYLIQIQRNTRFSKPLWNHFGRVNDTFSCGKSERKRFRVTSSSLAFKWEESLILILR